jgi:hypothetical protein
VSVLVEELVVDVELRVNISGMQDGDVLRSSGLDRPAAADIGGIRAAVEGADQGRTEPSCNRSDLRQEFAPRAHHQRHHTFMANIVIFALMA